MHEIGGMCSLSESFVLNDVASSLRGCYASPDGLFLSFVHLGSLSQQFRAHLCRTEASGIPRAGNVALTGELTVIAT